MCYNTAIYKLAKDASVQHAMRFQHCYFDLGQMHRLKDEAKRIQQKNLANQLKKAGVELYRGTSLWSLNFHLCRYRTRYEPHRNLY